MSSQFIGVTVLVTLKDAQNTQIQGLVTEVQAGGPQAEAGLGLSNVVFLKTGEKAGSYKVIGKNVADVTIVTAKLPSQPSLAPLPVQHLPPPPQQPQQQQHRNQNLRPQQFHAPAQSRNGFHRPIHRNYVPSVPRPGHLVKRTFAKYAQQLDSVGIPANIRSQTATQRYVPQPGNQQQHNPSQFEDPAILSMSRKPLDKRDTGNTAQHAAQMREHLQPQQALLETPPRQQPAQQAFETPSPAPVMSRSNSKGVRANLGAAPKLDIPTAVLINNSANTVTDSSKTVVNAYTDSEEPASPELQQPFSDMILRGDAADSSAMDETDDGFGGPTIPYTQQNKYTGKRSRRGKGNFRRQQRQQSMTEKCHQAKEQDEVIPLTQSTVIEPGMFGGPIALAAVGKSVGSTPARRKCRGQRARRPRRGETSAEEEAWATEDVNDYKQTEFDFQSNLKRFDKKTVFSQIKASQENKNLSAMKSPELTVEKADDMTADEERLVSFNRLPNRSFNRSPIKKNYHPTENVLGTYANVDPLGGRDDWKPTAEESEDSSDMDFRGRGGNTADSGRSSRRAMSRQSISTRRSVRQPAVAATVSRNSVENLQSLSSSANNAPGVAPRIGKTSLRLEPSGRPCPIISPLQMLDVERIAEVELGLTDDMMTENAGRAIAQIAIQAFGKRISINNHNALPVVLVFAGNNKTGSRAIAAGRHLKNHQVRVMVCVLGIDREDELLENIKRQLNIFRNAGGWVARWEEMQNNIKSLDSPPELVIDGLLGMHVGFDDLRTDDQATAFEMAQFANKGKANILSVDIPSGIDGTSGAITTLAEDAGLFYFRAHWVVCMGAPKSGLLHALTAGHGTAGHGAAWKLYVADIGISNTAWRKYGTRRRHGVEFAADWVVALQYHYSNTNNSSINVA